jgi:Tfp pilus assembly protein PilV
MFRIIRLKYSKAFTLIELLISLLVMVVASLGILLMFINNALLLENSRNTTIAINHIQTVMEEIRRVGSTSLDNVTSTNWTTWASSKGLNTLTDESIQVSISDASADPLDVTVTVSWKDKKRSRTLSMQMAVAQR